MGPPSEGEDRKPPVEAWGPKPPSTEHLPPPKPPSRRRRCCSALGLGPLVLPASAPLELLQLRRLYTSLGHRWAKDGGQKVPLSIFQQSVHRLCNIYGISEPLDLTEYDIDNTGSIGWTEVVACWRNSDVHYHLTFAERLFFAIEDPKSCVLGQCFSLFMTLLIFLSCMCFMLATLPGLLDKDCPSCEPQQKDFFARLEECCVLIFAAEYLLRLSTAPFCRGELLDRSAALREAAALRKMKHVTRRQRLSSFLLHPMNLVDLAIILPFFIEVLLTDFSFVNMAVLRIIRLTRLVRLLKLPGAGDALGLARRIVAKGRRMLTILLVYVLMILVCTSSLVYMAERGDWDSEAADFMTLANTGERVPSPFRSIPHTFWWCLVTLAGVGYGDVAPVTWAGQAAASCAVMLAIVSMSMPISVISSCFSKSWAELQAERADMARSLDDDVQAVAQALWSLESQTKLVVELFDDHGREGSEFLGEVCWDDLPTRSAVSVAEDRLITLQANGLKATAKKVAGFAHVSVKWTPAEEDGEDRGTSSGTLVVRVSSVTGLRVSDWKRQGLRDVFAVIHCWSRPPVLLSPSTYLQSASYRTSTVKSTLNPHWEEDLEFEYEWPANWDPLWQAQRKKEPMERVPSWRSRNSRHRNLRCDTGVNLRCIAKDCRAAGQCAPQAPDTHLAPPRGAKSPKSPLRWQSLRTGSTERCRVNTCTKGKVSWDEFEPECSGLEHLSDLRKTVIAQSLRVQQLAESLAETQAIMGQVLLKSTENLGLSEGEFSYQSRTTTQAETPAATPQVRQQELMSGFLS